MDDLVGAICKELELKKNRLSTQTIETIYFGGGTPSVLPEKALHQIISAIEKNYQLSKNLEFTLEANPDDLTVQKIKELRNFPVNRFSIGVQSFFEEDLLWMNRAHHAEEALSSVKRSQDAGFENLTIDLIYGFPLLSDTKWRQNIQTAINLQVPHISAYAMTVETRTVLAHQIKVGKTPALDDEQSVSQFLTLVDKLQNNGFEHYEVSNYAKSKHYAVHNTNYWKGVSYLGIGPSAHGFDGRCRYMNVANNAKYIKSINDNILPENIEELSLSDSYNEYVMTALRTMWGVDLLKVKNDFGQNALDVINKEIAIFEEEEKIIKENNKIFLTTKGKLFADGIASALFTDEEDL